MTAFEMDTSPDPTPSFHTEALGRLTIDGLNARHMLDVEEMLGGRKISPAELTDALLAVLARTESGKSLDQTQIGQISAKEKEDFADQVVKAEDHFYCDQIAAYKKNDKGKNVVSYQNEEIVLPREPAETATDYLYRGFMRQREKFTAIAAKLVGPPIDIAKLSNWADSSIINQIARNTEISGALSKNLAAMRVLGGLNLASASPLLKVAMAVPKPPSWGRGATGSLDAKDADQTRDEPSTRIMGGFPPNPAVVANERLADLVGRFDRVEVMAGQAIELVQSMNGIASGLLQKFVEGANSTERFGRSSILFARTSISVAVVALLLTVFQVGYDVWKSRNADEETRLIVKEVVSQITDAQRQTATEIRGTISDQTDRNHADQSELAKAITSLVDAVHALKERPARGQSDKLPARIEKTNPEPSRLKK